jgi:hypothetical protein
LTKNPRGFKGENQIFGKILEDSRVTYRFLKKSSRIQGSGVRKTLGALEPLGIPLVHYVLL